MSTSKQTSVTTHAFFGSLCDRLEAELSKKACATVQKAVDDTVCASLKHGIHAATQQAVRSDTLETTPGADTIASDICASLEEVTGNAVCAALKQAVTDTVCRAIKDAITTSLHNATRWEQEMPFHVTPEALNISLEEVTGNAVCAALKRVIADTVCKALKRAIDESVSFVVRTYDAQSPTSLSETISADASMAEAGQVYLGADGAWHTPQPTSARELCAALKQRMTTEVCTRLQQLAASALCPKLKKIVHDEIGRHTEQCKEEKSTERSPERNVARSVLTYKTGMMAFAVIAAAAIAVAALIPGMSVIPSPAPAATTLSLYPPAASIGAGGNATLTGVLKARDGSGIGGGVVELQRQAGGNWATLGSVTTLPDGTFTFELGNQGVTATTLRMASEPEGPLLGNRANEARFADSLYVSAALGADSARPSTYLFASSLHFTARTVTINVVSPSHPVRGDAIALSATVSPSYQQIPLGENVSATYQWTLTSPSGAVKTVSTNDNSYSFIADQSGAYVVDLTLMYTINGSSPQPMTTDQRQIDVGALGGPKADIQVSAPPYATDTAITLDGSHSTETSTQGGVITAYAWSIPRLPSDSSAAIVAPTTATTSFTPDKPGEYVIQLTVSDSRGAQNTASVSVTVPGSHTVNPPSPDDQQKRSDGKTTIIVPPDPSAAPNGHYYRASFAGSTSHATCTSAPVSINDTSTVQGTATAARPAAGLVSALLRAISASMTG